MKTTAARLLLAFGLIASPIQGFAETYLVENGAASVKRKLAQEGVTQYRITQSANATEPEKFVAKELAMFLKRVTGADFKIAEVAEGKCIHVGWTPFAAQHGIDCKELGEEEWVIRTVGDDLILTGGRPRGTMYAVYEFLEDYVGCHWLDRETEVIPSKATLEIPAIDVRDKPRFWQRQLHSPTSSPDNHWLFLIRNKNFRYDMKGRAEGTFFPKGAFSHVASPRTSIHSFSTFVSGEEWFETHPEYFSLVNGRRVPALTGGAGAALSVAPRCVAIDDGEAARVHRSRPPSRLRRGHTAEVVLDYAKRCLPHCECDNCRAIVRREGGESGPLIEFVNAVAEDIAEDYPDVVIGTLAYNLTSTPPKHIRPHDNVLVGWCDVYSKVDGIRPLEDPLNFQNHAEITAWGKVTRRLAIGDDYWTALGYYKHFPTPYAIIDCVAKDIRLFADQGAESVFVETPDYMDAAAVHSA
ncbi:MAG: DUF4838 domain-containing protein [Pirellulaceae bacterium]